MSTPQNPYGPDNGSGNQNPNGQSPNGQNGQQPNGPGYGGDQNGGQSGGQAPQYGSPNEQNQSFGSQPAQPQYGQQPPQYGQQDQQGQQQYGSQPQYGQQNDGGAQYDQNQYGQNPYDQNQNQNQNPYDQNQYGQNPYDANAQGYDANQYGQQPAYAGADGGSDQFTPANPNAGYGQFPPGTGGNTSKNIWGILALIGGIVGVLLSFVFGAGFLFGAAAVVFGFVGLGAVKKGTASNKGLNITGIVLGFISVLLSIIVVVALILGIGALGKFASDEASKSAGISTSGSSDPAQDPSDPAQDPSQGAGGAGGSEGGEAAPVQGGEVTIGTDVTAATAVAPGSTDTGIGADDSNGEIAIVTMTIRNNSGSDADLKRSRITATDGGSTTYDDVFEGNKFRGSLAFDEPIPAGGEKTMQFAFGVPSAELDGMHLELKLSKDLGSGTDFEFSKQ